MTQEQKDRLHAGIIAEHERFNQAIAGLDSVTLENTPVLGVWTTKHVAGNLIDWAEAILQAAETAVAGGTPELVSDGERFNQEHIVRYAERSWDDVKAELDAIIARAAGYVASLSVEQLDAPAVLIWTGQESTVGGLLSGIRGHHHEHVDELEEWRASRS
jgi:hypothetical protein